MPKRLRTEQVEFYHTNGFLGPVDLLTTEQAAEVRRHIEEIEARIGIHSVPASNSRQRGIQSSRADIETQPSLAWSDRQRGRREPCRSCAPQDWSVLIPQGRYASCVSP